MEQATRNYVDLLASENSTLPRVRVDEDDFEEWQKTLHSFHKDTSRQLLQGAPARPGAHTSTNSTLRQMEEYVKESHEGELNRDGGCLTFHVGHARVKVY